MCVCMWCETSLTWTKTCYHVPKWPKCNDKEEESPPVLNGGLMVWDLEPHQSTDYKSANGLHPEKMEYCLQVIQTSWWTCTWVKAGIHGAIFRQLCWNQPACLKVATCIHIATFERNLSWYSQELTAETKMFGYLFHTLLPLIPVRVFLQFYVVQPRSTFIHWY